MDEFQDSAANSGSHPSLFETLSRGGSLMGGRRQTAIYGWRGGDATLFDEVRSDAELCAVAPDRASTSPTNWRSCRAIVETNNTLFRQLSETATAKAVLSAMLLKTPSALLTAFLEKGPLFSKKALPVPEQKVAPDKAEGFLRLQRVYGDKSERSGRRSPRASAGMRSRSSPARRPWGTSPCWCAPAGRPHRSPDDSWRKDPCRHRQQLPARRASSGGTDHGAPDVPRFPAATIWRSGRPFRPPRCCCRLSSSEQAGRLGRRPPDGTPQHAAVHGLRGFPDIWRKWIALSMPTRDCSRL